MLLRIALGRVLTATIGMEDRARLGMLAKPRHRERVQYQVHRHPRFERPGDDSSGI